jgi:oligoendopeptidase F
MLLARHILAGSDDPRTRRSVIMQLLGTDHHNFVTHLLEAELQHRVYAMAEAGQAVTATLLNRTKATPQPIHDAVTPVGALVAELETLF